MVNTAQGSMPAAAANRMLMVAFHFPPCVGSSGLLRSLCFARDLNDLGWGIDVVTARGAIYEQTSEELVDTIPAAVTVHRARGWDTRRHLSIKGRYPDFLALPDRFVSWYFDAVRVGLGAMRRNPVDVVWSTYPVATSHLIGFTLSRLSGKPWIADFRDPMVEYVAREDTWYPQDAAVRKLRLAIERLAARRAGALVFCTEAARALYVERYGEALRTRTHVIPNGYDEHVFEALEHGEQPGAVAADAGITLVHSGTIYASADRDPSAFLAAVRALRERQLLVAGHDRIVLRASGSEAWLAPIIEREGVGDLVFLEARCSYQDALREVLAASGLLVFQGHTSNPAIPAKVYEYMRAGRPILGLVDDAGETAALLRGAGVANIADLASREAVAAELERFVRALRTGSASGVARDVAIAYSREHRALELGRVAAGLVASTPSGPG